ncbi:single-stranded DNA-binding protein [Bacteroides sp. BFG-638]|uniref:single-stranded DNA-binding protein n=1 Tax=unclassified Bacteroides TaxID=2646097 RepID=UPI00216604F3|nr:MULTISPECIES: single-stranded DNA-binding protein [unclassified Bacteroides]MCS2946998.1 single-stranded DNA-binding protein [Bacteroides sp. BFG-638]MCS3310626.1 single-stranded DNA-binding protein [Bacteroides sp. BFG-637]
MIKCNVTVNGVISRAASMRTGKEGKAYISFAVKVNVSSKNGDSSKAVEVSVLQEGSSNELAQYSSGSRVELRGNLTFRKRESNFYFNFHADSVDFSPVNNPDGIAGSMEFKGTIGKKMDEKTDKKGRQYLIFSAFSTEKDGDTFEYTWVRFIRFAPEREAFLIPKGKIHINGTLEISIYQDKINLGCRVEEISEWVKQEA